MKKLLTTNCFDTKETMIIIGSCLKHMQPKAYEQVLQIAEQENIYEICLEETHMNMAVTKLIGMLARKKVKTLIFITVDKSPHCIQLHYIYKELENCLDMSQFTIKNIVAVNNELIEIPPEILSISKNLSKLKETIGSKQLIDKIAFIFIKDKKMLSTRSKGKEVYYIPGGKREKNENDIETLTREVKEELTIDLIPETIHYYGTFQAQAHGKKEGITVKMTCYQANYEGKIEPSSEIEEITWLTYQDIHKVSPVDKIIMKDLYEKGIIE